MFHHLSFRVIDKCLCDKWLRTHSFQGWTTVQGDITLLHGWTRWFFFTATAATAAKTFHWSCWFFLRLRFRSRIWRIHDICLILSTAIKNSYNSQVPVLAKVHNSGFKRIVPAIPHDIICDYLNLCVHLSMPCVVNEKKQILAFIVYCSFTILRERFEALSDRSVVLIDKLDDFGTLHIIGEPSVNSFNFFFGRGQVPCKFEAFVLSSFAVVFLSYNKTPHFIHSTSIEDSWLSLETNIATGRLRFKTTHLLFQLLFYLNINTT